MYQVGVLIFRSSIAVVGIRYFWVLSIVQVRVLTEELVYKSRVQPSSLPPRPSPIPPSLSTFLPLPLSLPPPPPPQILNFYFLFCETVYLFIPSFWIIVFIILFEGMLGGAVYADVFYSISVEVSRSINPLPITVRNS